MTRNININELGKQAGALKAGEHVLVSGTLYTARDSAHKEIEELIKSGKKPPFELDGSVIYYCGPCPARPGEAIGPCGPTTSSRMDSFTPLLLSKGVRATIGKGPRSKEVADACRRYGAVYLAATGGIATLLAKKVKYAELVAFKELGPEAVYRLEVSDFPAVVAIDASGASVFDRDGK
ncbi:MAG: fumarate hydratase C-terminal domain-containing protein [Endomicrobiales bacterium]|nr:fumarate hydratase C-terminal domain-containing protein [Endomicrobiales bacterium]